MDTLDFLEQLALSTSQDQINSILDHSPSKIKQSFLRNDPEALKKQIDSNMYFANRSEVVREQLL